MNIFGKILFYSENDGNGIIITKEHEKYNFLVENWNDFDTLPKAGLSVTCKLEGELITAIEITQNPTEVSTQAKAQESENTEANSSVGLLKRDKNDIDKIRLSVPVKICVSQYFQQIENNIQKRISYKNSSHRLDFLKMRRFLYTMYNNLTELDMHFITPRIKVMRDDLLAMSQVYDDFKSKVTYPDIAFEKVFLSRQEEYIIIREIATNSFEKLGGLREAEGRLSEVIEEKEEVLDRTLRVSTQFDRLDDQQKELKSSYVDTVHMMASLDEEYHQDLELMMAFEQAHKDDFFELFQEASQTYKEQIVGILDAQAFLFDEQLWMQAQRSRIIQNFFQESNIQGEYCSKTFLKYYLNSLDQSIVSQEQRELFKLYEYLDSLSRDSVVVVVNDMDKVFHFKALFSKITLSLDSQVFIESKKAFSWMQKHPTHVLILDKNLDKTNAESFVQQVRDKIGSRTKVVLLGVSKIPQKFDDVMSEHVRAGLFKEQLEKLLKDDNG